MAFAPGPGNLRSLRPRSKTRAVGMTPFNNYAKSRAVGMTSCNNYAKSRAVGMTPCENYAKLRAVGMTPCENYAKLRAVGMTPCESYAKLRAVGMTHSYRIIHSCVLPAWLLARGIRVRPWKPARPCGRRCGGGFPSIESGA